MIRQWQLFTCILLALCLCCTTKSIAVPPPSGAQQGVRTDDGINDGSGKTPKKEKKEKEKRYAKPPKNPAYKPIVQLRDYSFIWNWKRQDPVKHKQVDISADERRIQFHIHRKNNTGIENIYIHIPKRLKVCKVNYHNCEADQSFTGKFGNMFKRHSVKGENNIYRFNYKKIQKKIPYAGPCGKIGILHVNIKLSHSIGGSTIRIEDGGTPLRYTSNAQSCPLAPPSPHLRKKAIVWASLKKR